MEKPTGENNRMDKGAVSSFLNDGKLRDVLGNESQGT